MTKLWATILLLAALIGAFVSWFFRANFWGGLFLAACEAALVGALADWFAVIALFRHPMGLKFIPHTAIIPNNKKRIIDSIVYLVENEWLNAEMINEKIRNFNIMDKGYSLLQSKGTRERLKAIIASALANIINNIKPEQMAAFIEKVIRENGKEIEINTDFVYRLEQSAKKLYMEDFIDLLAEGAKDIINTQAFEKLIQSALRKAAEDYSKNTFLRRLSRGIVERFDILNYGEAAESINKKLLEILDDMKSEYSPHRAKLKQALLDYKISDRINICSLLEDAVARLSDSENGHIILTDIIEAVKSNIVAAGVEDSPMVVCLANAAFEQFEKVYYDAEKKNCIEIWIKNEAYKIIEKFHNVIGKLVRENLESLNDELFVGSLEERVGDDLQWIRINGTVIGGLVGILQYLILHAL